LDYREFQLLCSQESRAEVTQYTKCNLARVPSHAVMIRPDINHHLIFGLLDKAQVLLLMPNVIFQGNMKMEVGLFGLHLSEFLWS